jgi:hypothetical protein
MDIVISVYLSGCSGMITDKKTQDLTRRRSEIPDRPSRKPIMKASTATAPWDSESRSSDPILNLFGKSNGKSQDLEGYPTVFCLAETDGDDKAGDGKGPDAKPAAKTASENADAIKAVVAKGNKDEIIAALGKLSKEERRDMIAEYKSSVVLKNGDPRTNALQLDLVMKLGSAGYDVYLNKALDGLEKQQADTVHEWIVKDEADFGVAKQSNDKLKDKTWQISQGRTDALCKYFKNNFGINSDKQFLDAAGSGQPPSLIRYDEKYFSPRKVSLLSKMAVLGVFEKNTGDTSKDTDLLLAIKERESAPAVKDGDKAVAKKDGDETTLSEDAKKEVEKLVADAKPLIPELKEGFYDPWGPIRAKNKEKLPQMKENYVNALKVVDTLGKMKSPAEKNEFFKQLGTNKATDLVMHIVGGFEAHGMTGMAPVPDSSKESGAYIFTRNAAEKLNAVLDCMTPEQRRAMMTTYASRLRAIDAKAYEGKNDETVIFQHLNQHMDQNSYETWLNHMVRGFKTADGKKDYEGEVLKQWLVKDEGDFNKLAADSGQKKPDKNTWGSGDEGGGKESYDYVLVQHKRAAIKNFLENRFKDGNAKGAPGVSIKNANELATAVGPYSAFTDFLNDHNIAHLVNNMAGAYTDTPYTNLRHFVSGSSRARTYRESMPGSGGP